VELPIGSNQTWTLASGFSDTINPATSGMWAWGYCDWLTNPVVNPLFESHVDNWIGGGDFVGLDLTITCVAR
jgi:hypothetical protein